MGRSPCCSKQGLNRGAWTKEEDMILSTYIQTHGDGGWKILPHKAGLNRCGKSCRLRWKNYLRPDIKRGRISADEEDLIIRMHRLLGNRWSLIAGRLPGRTDNEIKNYWNTQLSKKLPPLKQSQANSSTKSLETKWRSSSPLPTHVFKAIPLKITTAMGGSGIVKENSYNSDGCNNPSLNGAPKSCNVNETGNFSQSCCDLLANNSITPDDSERIAFQTADANFVEAEFVDEESPHSDHCGGNTAILAESLLDLSDLSLPHWNLLFSSSDCDTDFGLEELYRGAAMELNEFEDFMCSDQNNMEKVKSFAVVANQGIAEHCHSMHAYCMDEVVHLQETKTE